ncbi:MAG: hypothetical protein HYV07_03325, partial [Deltaproteobacteria bacterium]|nr:hypothetical protein [Deltaproteobacteria bacterium]
REGEQKGRLETLRNALVMLAKARKLRLGKASLARIEATTNPEVLERWLRASISARTMREVFAAE